jgi:8-oxo-dGTP pyrophosphatase MutT (NUDIX family)
MTSIFTVTHPERLSPCGQLSKREAVRAVIADGTDLLMLYTRRYDDYSFPGGGVAEGEENEACLLRELQEETGAAAVAIKRYLGYVDELRPDRRDSPDTMLMRSHFYECTVERTLGKSSPEDYEVANGMVAVWVDARTALEHNEALLRTRPQNMGLSIYRETQMLRYVLSQQ